MVHLLKSHKFPEILSIILLCCLSLFIVACNMNISEEGLASVSLVLGYGSKSLLIDTSEDSVEFKYFVSYQSQLANIDEKVFQSLNVVNNNAHISNLKPGSCDIYILGYINGKKVYHAQKSVNIEAGSENTIFMSLERVDDTNTATVIFSIASSCDQIVISYCGLKTNNEGEIVISDAQNGVFYANKELIEDSYEFVFCLYTDGIKTGGETVACDIKAGQGALISGDIIEGLSTAGGLDITKTEDIYVKVGETVNFYFASGGENLSYRWLLDNSEVLSTSSICSYKSIDGKSHNIKCFIGDNKYETLVKGYYHETVMLSFEDLINALRYSDQIYKGINQNGKSVTLAYSQTVEYSSFDTLSFDDLEALGIEAIVASPADISTSRTLIIPENASVSVSDTLGWVNQKLEKRSNTKLSLCYSFKNLEPYCLYGCISLLEVHLMGQANRVYAHALGGCSVKEEKIHCSNGLILDDYALDL